MRLTLFRYKYLGGMDPFKYVTALQLLRSVEVCAFGLFANCSPVCPTAHVGWYIVPCCYGYHY